MPKQGSDPLGILDIGFSSGNMLDMLGVHNQSLNLFRLQQVVDRFPVRTGTLHGGVGATFTLDPVHHHEQVVSHCREGTDFLLIWREDTGHNGFFMDIESANMTVDNTMALKLLAA